MTTNLDARLNQHAPAVLSLFRVVFALLLLCHATSHLFGWPVAAMQAEVGAWPEWYGGVFELVTGVLMAIGLFTRIAAFVASGVMAFAYFTAHFPTDFWPIVNKGELAVAYCFAFFLLIFTGGGSFALDQLRGGAHSPKTLRTTAFARRVTRR